MQNWTWRLIFGFPLVSWGMITLYFLVLNRLETPRFYLENGQIDKAREVIATIYDTGDSGHSVEQVLAYLQERLQRSGKSAH